MTKKTKKELPKNLDKNKDIKLKTMGKKIDYKDKYLRMLAELENARKRMQREKQENTRFAIENTILEFLPSLDNFENALNFSKNASEEVQKWATGFQMIHSQLRDVLHNNGIVAFHSEGNLFDPHFHEALEIVETNEHPDGTILEEYAKGYKSGSRVVRPAKVKVAKKPFKVEEELKIKEELKTKETKINKEG